MSDQINKYADFITKQTEDGDFGYPTKVKESAPGTGAAPSKDGVVVMHKKDGREIFQTNDETDPALEKYREQGHKIVDYGKK